MFEFEDSDIGSRTKEKVDVDEAGDMRELDALEGEAISCRLSWPSRRESLRAWGWSADSGNVSDRLSGDDTLGNVGSKRRVTTWNQRV